MNKTTSLFDKYSQNLKILAPYINKFKYVIERVPKNEGLYYCPLSLRFYAKSLLNKTNGRELTLEHVPPKTLGGKSICLTAKDVNNKSGKIDNCILERHRILLANKNKSVKTFKAKIENRHNVELVMDQFSDQLKLWFKSDGKNLKLNEFMSMLNEPPGSFNVTINFGEDTLSLNGIRGYLKCLYLVAFSTFGYSLLFNTNGIINPIYKHIIELINSRDNNQEIPFVFEWDFPKELQKFNFVEDNENHKALLVCIRINGFGVAAIFPSPNETDLNYHNHFHPSLGKELNLLHLFDEDINLNTYDGALCFWNIWKSFEMIE